MTPNRLASTRLAALVLAPAVLLSTLGGAAHAQDRSRHADTWNFGTRCRFQWDATASSFTMAQDPAISTGEGSASFSDPVTGALLVYTDGIKVWTPTGVVANPDADLPGDPSSMHSGVIVPVPGSPGDVYVFGHPSQVSSSVVYRRFDVTAGVTAVGTNQTVNLGANAGREGMVVAPHANGVDYWLLVSGATSIFVIPITSAGVGTPTTTPSGLQVWDFGWHLFALSHQSNRLAMSGNATGAGATPAPIAVWDFDNATGVLSNRSVLDGAFGTGTWTGRFQYYGGAFSPNGRRLYFATLDESNASSGPSRFYQYDFDGSTFYELDSNPTRYTHGDARLGPDGRIYVAGGGGSAMDVIMAPDAVGAAVDFRAGSITAPTGCTFQLGLPQSPSPTTDVQLDLSVNILGPAGVVTATSVTPAGSANAPNGATITVVVDRPGGSTQSCVATVSNAAWSCPEGSIDSLVGGTYTLTATLTFGNDSATDQESFCGTGTLPYSPAGAACISSVGCADGTREGFVDETTYPIIASCGGAWDVPGMFHDEPACERQAGNTGVKKQGLGCNVEDLCAPGWHVCHGPDDVERRTGGAGCVDAVAVDYPSNGSLTPTQNVPPGAAFFAGRTSGPGNLICDNVVNGMPSTFNDIFGCGNFGSSAGNNCAPLTVSGNNQCGALQGAGAAAWGYAAGEAAWACHDGANGFNESRVVTKTRPDDQGGVMCCKDSDPTLPELCDGADNDDDGEIDEIDFDDDGDLEHAGDLCTISGGPGRLTCTTDGNWQCTPIAPEVCEDTLDNDLNAYVDVYDLQCAAPEPTCTVPVTPAAFSIRKAAETDSVYEDLFWPITGDIDADGRTEILTANQTFGRLDVLDGETLAVESSIAINGDRGDTFAIAELDGDAALEVVAITHATLGATANLVWVADWNGSAWVVNRSTTTVFACGGNVGAGLGVGLADFDADGKPEIFYGNEIWTYPDDLTTGCTGCITKVVDGDTTTGGTMKGCLTPVVALDGAGPQGMVSSVADVLARADCTGNAAECDGPELVVAGQVFSVDVGAGTITLRVDVNTFGAGQGYGDGFTAVADLDADGDLDVAVAGNAPGGDLYAYDPKARTVLRVWNLTGTTGHGYSPITIADVFDEDLDDDGDTSNGSALNVPELIVTRRRLDTSPVSGDLHAVNVGSATPVWTQPTLDNSGSTASTVFDFNGDGILEIAYRDVSQMRVMYGGPLAHAPAGVDAASRNYAAFACDSATMNEGPTVADVDDDGAAELVVLCGQPSARLTVFESASVPWRQARHVWNQPMFDPGAIDELGRIYPVAQARSSRIPEGSGRTPLNGNIAQSSPLDYLQGDPNLVPAIDAVISDVSVSGERTCLASPGTYTVRFTIRNDGDALVPDALPIAIYDSEPGDISPVIQEPLSAFPIIAGTLPMAKGASVTFERTLTMNAAAAIWVVLNDAGGGATLDECDPSDNTSAPTTCTLIGCNPDSATLPSEGCDHPTPVCQLSPFDEGVECVACVDDSAGGIDSGCNFEVPSCNPFTNECGPCEDDPSCVPQGECPAEAPGGEVPVDEGCESPDIFLAGWDFCEGGCAEGLPYGTLSIILGNGSTVDADNTTVVLFSEESGQLLFGFASVPGGGTGAAQIALPPGSTFPFIVSAFSLAAGECDPSDNDRILPYAPLFADLDDDDVPDVCDACIAGQNPEICDGFDNDCDGDFDEGCDDDDDGFCDAAIGCGEGFEEVCPNGCGDCDDTVGSVNPGGVEVCNGVDDDCDETADDGIVPVPITCGVGACRANGQRVCQGATLVDQCTPGTPAADDATCDGVDNDCAGGTDEDYAPVFVACEDQCLVRAATSCQQGRVIVPECLPREDGTLCESHACALAAECQDGTCVATRIRSCDDGNPCTADACDPASGCVADNVDDGTQCSDGNGCTTGDTCTDGVCGGTGVGCAPPAECERPGECNPATGVCDYTFIEGCTACGEDAVAPVLVCPAAPEATQCTQGGTAVTLGAPSARDECSAVQVATDAPNLYSGGVTLVTFTATDAAGNSTSCQVPVEVEDTEPPQIFCQEVTTVEGDPGTCGAIVTVRPSVIDDCDGTDVTLAGIGVDGAFFPPGPTDVLITAIDAAGNQATCETIIDVVGLDDFDVVCEATVEKVAPADFCGWPEALTAEVVDECDSTIQITSEVPSFPIGESDVVFDARRDDGAADTCTTRLTVVDATDPVVSCGHPDAKVDLVATFVPSVYDACTAVTTITDAGCERETDGSSVAVSERCEVTVEDDSTVIVTDAPPSEDGDIYVVWTVTATDPSGNATVVACRAPVDPESLDHDKDGIIDRNDNCIETPNTDQLDTDLDQVGDACDEAEFDGLFAEGSGGCDAGGGVGAGLVGLALALALARRRRAGR